MKYKELQEPCKSCLGCMRLEDENFISDKNCKYVAKPIEKIKQILGIQEVLKLKNERKMERD